MWASRIAIVRGHPTDREVAAVAEAVARHLAATAPPDPPGSQWIRAARLEGSGHPPIDSPAWLTR